MIPRVCRLVQIGDNRNCGSSAHDAYGNTKERMMNALKDWGLYTVGLQFQSFSDVWRVWKRWVIYKKSCDYEATREA